MGLGPGSGSAGKLEVYGEARLPTEAQPSLALLRRVRARAGGGPGRQAPWHTAPHHGPDPRPWGCRGALGATHLRGAALPRHTPATLRPEPELGVRVPSGRTGR